MGKVLTILEVSRKQEYIFASKKLRENAERSQDIADLTSSTFFMETAGETYSDCTNLISTGGGHAALQFDSREAAADFTQLVTLAALETYPELELFARTIDYAPGLDPGDNLKALTSALEAKKARRTSSFRWLDLGVELPQDVDSRPRPDSRKHARDIVPPPEGYAYFSQPDQETDDNFIAVVHIDGNNMGARAGGLYQRYKGKTDSASWESCRKDLQTFSKSIQADFETAFSKLADTLARWTEQTKILPLRPIILAGDDVCFVTAGSIGLECARIFIKELTSLTNEADGQPYAACAGVALVHQKYPFHRAYQLAEALCDNAKKYGADLDDQRRISVMDWHIEFGQLKDSLSDLRQDYQTEDGCRLELRPVSLVLPPDPKGTIPDVPERTYSFFYNMCRTMKDCSRTVARSKIKELRTALKQGEIEARFFLHDKEISELLYHPLEIAYTQAEWAEKLQAKDAFQAFPAVGGTERRCLFFDAIEMIDHFTPFEEVAL